jgi:hypothetical protein
MGKTRSNTSRTGEGEARDRSDLRPGGEDRITVELIFPAVRHGSPDKARAICQARLTPTQVVVESGEVVEQNSSTPVKLGDLPYRFNRRTGRRIPYIRGSTWRLGKTIPKSG